MWGKSLNSLEWWELVSMVHLSSRGLSRRLRLNAPGGMLLARSRVCLNRSMATIYKATNTTNGKLYIGFTSHTLEYRWKRHVKRWKAGEPTILYKAFSKYGPESFRVESIFESSNREECLEKEKEFIKLFRSHMTQNGYNMTFGGEGSWGRPPWNKNIVSKDNLQSKLYTLVSPTGETFQVRGLKTVTEYGLKVNSMSNTLLTHKPISMGKRKGWQLFRMVSCK